MYQSPNLSIILL